MSASPAPEHSGKTSTASFAAGRKGAPPSAKPVNVFTNDGSFLSKFRKANSEADEEKRKQDEALARKKAADERFKKRGKRPAADSPDELAAKKKKEDEPLTAYQKEVAKLAARDLKEEGGGRPIMK